MVSAVLDRIERWGNKLPHPFNLFLLFGLRGSDSFLDRACFGRYRLPIR